MICDFMLALLDTSEIRCLVSKFSDVVFFVMLIILVHLVIVISC